MSPYRLQFTFYRLARTIRCGISHSAYAKLLLTVGHKDWVQPIKRLLAVKGWTQGDLAEHAKIRPTTLSAAMNGRPPRMQTMEAVREETASELAGPKPLEAPPVKKKKRA
jgi:hypothetical protein